MHLAWKTIILAVGRFYTECIYGTLKKTALIRKRLKLLYHAPLFLIDLATTVKRSVVYRIYCIKL